MTHLLRSLALTAGEIANSSRLTVERVSAIMEGAPASLSELRALSRGLRMPLRSFATGQLTSTKQTELGLLFRNSAEGRRSDQRTTIEHVAGFVRRHSRCCRHVPIPPNGSDG